MGSIEEGRMEAGKYERPEGSIKITCVSLSSQKERKRSSTFNTSLNCVTSLVTDLHPFATRNIIWANGWCGYVCADFFFFL